jgi:drug/metabolite transporter (DMT)-like permease
LNYYGFMEGLLHTSPSNAQVFIQLGPVGFAIVGIFIYREKVTWRSFAGLIMVLSGLFLFYYNQLSGLKGFELEYKKGILLVLAGAVCWAVFASLQKKLVAKWDANQMNLVIYAVCSLMFLPIADISKLLQLNFLQWLLLVSLGLNTVLSYGFLALAIKYADANKVSVVITLNPIITFITMAILGTMGVSWIAPENFNLYSIIGAIAVIGGAIITILSRKKNGITENTDQAASLKYD